MPSSISLPVFYEREQLTYQKLNAAMDAISTRFAAGVGAAEISWPLTAEGNLNMDVYNITGARSIWGFVNAAEFEDFDAAVTEAGSGGVVLVPPDTTIVTNGSSLSGTGVTVIGSGPSSVLRLTSGSTAGYMLRVTGGTRALIANLTLDGNSATGVSQTGLQINACVRAMILNCNFLNFSGAMLEVLGASDSVTIMGCHFIGGTEEHIHVTRCNRMVIGDCTFRNAGSHTLRLECADASAAIDAVISNCIIDDCNASAVRFRGFNAVGAASPGRLWLSNVQVLAGGGVTQNAFDLGSSAATLEEVQVNGCSAKNATQHGIYVVANYGTIVANRIESPAGTGIDLEDSRYLVVSNNYVHGGAVGIDASDGQDCSITGNILRDCTTPIALGGTDHAISNNPGAGYGASAGGSLVYYTGVNQEYSGAVDNSTVALFDLPANSLRQGSLFTMRLNMESGNDGTEGRTVLYCDSHTVASAYIRSGTTDGCWLLVDAYVSSFTDGVLIGGSFGAKEGVATPGVSIDTGTFSVTGLDFTTDIRFRLEADAGTTRLTSVFVKFDHATQTGFA